MYWYFTFPKAPELDPHHQIQFSIISKRGLIPTLAEMQLVYSTAPADWARWFSVISGTLIGGGVLPLCRDAAPPLPSKLGSLIFYCNWDYVCHII